MGRRLRQAQGATPSEKGVRPILSPQKMRPKKKGAPRGASHGLGPKHYGAGAKGSSNHAGKMKNHISNHGSSHQAPPAQRDGSRGKGSRAAQNQRIYRQVAQALTRLLAADASKQGGASIKSLTLAPSNVAKKATHALTCQTLRYLPVLKAVLSAAGVLAPDLSGSGGGTIRGSNGVTAQGPSNRRAPQAPGKKGDRKQGPQVWPELAYVVTYDLLFGQKQAASAAAGGAGPGAKREGKDGGSAGVLRAVTSRRSALQAELARLVVREGVGSAEELAAKMGGIPLLEALPVAAGGHGDQQGVQQELAFPRYARVNTLKTSLEEVKMKLGLKGGSKGESLKDGEKLEASGIEKGTKAKGKDQGHKGWKEPGEGRELGSRTDEEAALDAMNAQSSLHGGNGQTIPGAREGLRPEPASPLQFECDALIPNVLQFPAGTDLHAHPLVRSGQLILQGRASCIPAAVLAPSAGSHVVDACAAPGNKTTHLAAIMGGTGKIWACERDPRRAETLAGTVARAGASGMVEVVQGDFLKVDVAAPEFAQVSAVLVDPSCSGSGTAVSRMDHLLPSSRGKLLGKLPGKFEGGQAGGKRKHGDSGGDKRTENDAEKDAERDVSGNASTADAAEPEGDAEDKAAARIERLARFQEAALRHALAFPAAERVVYSTCSVHARENEGVVQRVLPQAKELGFQLAKALPAWPRRGLPQFPFAELVVRTNPAEDQMEGFFVALFVRKKGHERGPLSPAPGHGTGSDEACKGVNGGPKPLEMQSDDDEAEHGSGGNGAAMGRMAKKRRAKAKRTKQKGIMETSY